ncbi:MAG: TRAP transporter substrate-binding protein [Halofilum sp. (in: g-proteobacteria)]|nr:TRAP transporter substrate-binding protein [Halofilum sp. (in: g-proteobacteria)]
MKRRQFLGTVGAGAMLGTGLAASNTASAAEPIEWRMVTTWPKDFPGLGTGANYLAETIGRLSGGRINVKVYGAGELVDAFGIFDLVSDGGAELGHGASYYWKGKSQAAQFFAAVPFGLTAQEMNAWFYHGDGMKLWEQVYEPFGLQPMAAGNTGVQMGGWFNKEINSVDDLKGLKMRIPGLGGEVLKRAGGTPVSLPGGEIFTSLETGAIDATEWVGPYNDLAFGLYKAARYYYYPGWHEPGTTLECFVNKEALQKLPQDLQQVVLHAGRVANQDMLADFTARNNQALQTLIDKHGVELRRFPDGVLNRLRSLSEEVVASVAEQDEMSKKVYESFRKFRTQAIAWHDISERAYLNARAS